MFGLFKKRDPICGMKEEKGKGIEQHGIWFCSEHCLNEYEKELHSKDKHKKGCC